MTENDESTDRLMKRFVEENGSSLREVLQETDEFLWDSIHVKRWTYKDMEYIHDVVLFILHDQIKKCNDNSVIV